MLNKNIYIQVDDQTDLIYRWQYIAGHMRSYPRNGNHRFTRIYRCLFTLTVQATKLIYCLILLINIGIIPPPATNLILCIKLIFRFCYKMAQITTH